MSLLTKFIDFFVERPKSNSFWLSSKCPEPEERYVFTLVNDKVSVSADSTVEKDCYAIKNEEATGENVYVNFCPIEKRYIPLHPFLIVFTLKIVEEEYFPVNRAIFVVNAKNLGCPIFQYLILDINAGRILSERITIEGVREEEFRDKLDEIFSILELKGAGERNPQMIVFTDDREVIEKARRISKTYPTADLEQLVDKIFVFKEKLLEEVVNRTYPYVKIPTKLKTSRLLLILLLAVFTFAGIKGYKYYQQKKLEEEMAKKKTWHPSRFFKKQHVQYILEKEKKYWGTLENLLEPKAVYLKEANLRKNTLVYILASQYPVVGFELKSRNYEKLFKLSFPVYANWKELRFKPPKKIQSAKGILRLGKEMGWTVIKASPQNLFGVNLFCIDYKIEGKYTYKGALAIAKALKEINALPQKGGIKRISSDLYSVKLKVKTCGVRDF